MSFAEQNEWGRIQGLFRIAGMGFLLSAIVCLCAWNWKAIPVSVKLAAPAFLFCACAVGALRMGRLAWIPNSLACVCAGVFWAVVGQVWQSNVGPSGFYLAWLLSLTPLALASPSPFAWNFCMALVAAFFGDLMIRGEWIPVLPPLLIILALLGQRVGGWKWALVPACMAMLSGTFWTILILVFPGQWLQFCSGAIVVFGMFALTLASRDRGCIEASSFCVVVILNAVAVRLALVFGHESMLAAIFAAIFILALNCAGMWLVGRGKERDHKFMVNATGIAVSAIFLMILCASLGVFVSSWLAGAAFLAAGFWLFHKADVLYGEDWRLMTCLSALSTIFGFIFFQFWIGNDFSGSAVFTCGELALSGLIFLLCPLSVVRAPVIAITTGMLLYRFMDISPIILEIGLLIALLPLFSAPGIWWGTVFGALPFLFVSDFAMHLAAPFLCGVMACLSVARFFVGMNPPILKSHSRLAFMAAIACAAGLIVPASPVVGLRIALMRSKWLAGFGIIVLFSGLIIWYWCMEAAFPEKIWRMTLTGAMMLGIGLWKSGIRVFSPLEVSRFRVVMVAAACAAGLMIFGAGVMDRMRIAEEGKTLYLKIVPSDPRAFMLGDYMALRYSLDRKRINGDRFVPVTDERGVVLEEISSVPDGGGHGEMGLRVRDGRIDLPRWFLFQEGSAADYADADYAELRCDPEGRCLVMALRKMEEKK